VVECLPSKCNALSSNPGHQIYKYILTIIIINKIIIISKKLNNLITNHQLLGVKQEDTIKSK
jgi:hypothetical protein